MHGTWLSLNECSGYYYYYWKLLFSSEISQFTFVECLSPLAVYKAISLICSIFSQISILLLVSI